MAVQFQNTQNPKDVAANQRALIQQKGDQLSEQQGAQIGQEQNTRQRYQDYLDQIEGPMAAGQGGYTPEEIQQIEAQGGMPQALTDEQAQGNYLTPDEQQAIKGDTGSYTRNFNPDQASQDQAVSAGQQRQAVNNLKQGVTNAVGQADLSQSGKFQQDSENQLGQNQGGFGTTLGAVGSNVRGAIDPNAVTASDSFLKDYQMTPEEQQQIITGAGISAGAKDAAATDAAERSARATGASPAGVSAYRARMARAQASDAGDAMTKARVAASEAAAARELSGEQLREQGGQYLTSTKTGSELALGGEALSGEQALGQQALAQMNAVEAQRVADEQAKAGLNLNAATTAGQADVANEANINSEGRQQQQFNTTTGTGIAQAQDTANSNRAGAVAGNRQATAVGNQGTQFGQQATNNNTASTRATGIANTRLGQQTQGLNYYQGQNQQANQNEENAQNREVSTYGTQAGGTNQAANTALAASAQPGTLSKVVGGVTGAVGALGGGAGLKALGLADGGVFDKPTNVVVGEDGPEKIMSMDSGEDAGTFTSPTSVTVGDKGVDAVVPLGYRARAKVRPSVAMGMQPQRRGRVPYQGVSEAA